MTVYTACLSAGDDDDDDDCYNENYRAGGNATGTDGEGICCQQTLPNTHFHRHIPLISTLHTLTRTASSLQSSNLAVSTPFLWPGRNSSSSEFHCNEMKTDTLAFAPAVRLGTLLETLHRVCLTHILPGLQHSVWLVLHNSPSRWYSRSTFTPFSHSLTFSLTFSVDNLVCGQQQ